MSRNKRQHRQGPSITVIKRCLLGVTAVLLSGCGTFMAGTVPGPNCPYQGVQTDLEMATSWRAIKQTYGAIVPLAVIDMPFSFVMDTFRLLTIEKLDGCPRKFE